MNTMQSSELILNPDGSIYHLNLLPEHLADKIILVGDPGRVQQISQYFDHIEFKTQKREFITHTGSYDGKRITVLSTGIGCDNIDIVINEIDALLNIDFEKRTPKNNIKTVEMIRIGTCGSLNGAFDVDQFIASTHGFGLDNLLHFYQYESSKEEKEILDAFLAQSNWPYHLKPYITAADDSLLKRIGHDMHQAITATAGGFYAPQGRQLRGKLSIDNINEQLQAFKYYNHRIGNFEMETSALYGLGGRVLGHKCLTVCNIIANRVNKTFSEDPYKSLDVLIKTVLERI